MKITTKRTGLLALAVTFSAGIRHARLSGWLTPPTRGKAGAEPGPRLQQAFGKHVCSAMSARSS